MDDGWLLVRAVHVPSMAFFVGGQLVLAAALVPVEHFEQWEQTELQLKLGLVVLVGVLIGWHMRRPDLRALDGAIFVVSLVIVWLGLSLAH